MPRDMFEAHFEKLRNETAPLAARMRPQTLADYVGQEHLVGEGRALRRASTRPSLATQESSFAATRCRRWSSLPKRRWRLT